MKMVLIFQIMKVALDLGWRLIASADLSAKFHRQEDGPDYPLDVDTFFFAANVI
jgi:hypothetical protein